MDIKNSVPMRLLAAEKIKHPYFFKRIEQLVRDKEAEWDLTYCYCPIWVGMSYVIFQSTLPAGGATILCE